MAYLDTSVLVKLYVKEKHSRQASDWVRRNDQAIPITIFHKLEFTNALQLKTFRAEMNKKQSDGILERFREHEKQGIFYAPEIKWADVLNYSLELSTRHTRAIGSRSLDIIHVASALAWKADVFYTFDTKQSELAEAAGMQIDT